MILCVGLSPALDLTYRLPGLVAGGTNRATSVTTRPGGKALNVARVLHRLGEPVRALVPLGGAVGAEVAGGLASTGIAADVVPSGVPTRRTVSLVADDGTATLVNEPAGIDCWPELLEWATTAVGAADVLAVSGSLPAGAPEDAIGLLVTLARRAGVPVVVDTSGPALLHALAAGPTMVKPNADELAEVTGTTDPVRAASELAAQYATTVVASLGPAGVYAVDEGGEAFRARPGRVLTGNPTGAGDAVVAGLARGLLHGWGLERSLAGSVALSAAAVLDPVAGDVDPEQVALQLPGVRSTSERARTRGPTRG